MSPSGSSHGFVSLPCVAPTSWRRTQSRCKPASEFLHRGVARALARVYTCNCVWTMRPAVLFGLQTCLACLAATKHFNHCRGSHSAPRPMVSFILYSPVFHVFFVSKSNGLQPNSDGLHFVLPMKANHITHQKETCFCCTCACLRPKCCMAMCILFLKYQDSISTCELK